MSADAYPSDLNDAEWSILEPLVVPAPQAGHPQTLELRRTVDAVFYLLRTGCQRRAIPHEFPPWSAVYYHYAKWRHEGTWERINAALRERCRVALRRAPQPTAAIIDSQSVKTTEAGGPHGYDGGSRRNGVPAAARRSIAPPRGKKISGRKRHILVDTQGNLLKAKVHPADLQDRRGAELLLDGLAAEFPAIALMWANSAYQGLKTWLAETLGWALTITKHWWTGVHGFWLAPGQEPPAIPTGFHVLPRRWVVERTFAWMGRNRRMSKDYEHLIETGELLIYMSMARVMLRRLAKPAT